MNSRRYMTIIESPGGRRGWEGWLGPIGIAVTWPMLRPAWSWGWWRVR